MSIYSCPVGADDDSSVNVLDEVVATKDVHTGTSIHAVPLLPRT